MVEVCKVCIYWSKVTGTGYKSLCVIHNKVTDSKTSCPVFEVRK